MNGEQVNLSQSILLSREELLYVLDLLEAESVPGLDDDPLGDLTPEQRSLALIWAERALRARELARVQEDGLVVLHKALLAAVGVSAYPQSTIFAYHWPAAGEVPRLYFGHLRQDEIVAHARPEDVLHLFTLLPSKKELVEQVLAACDYQDGEDLPAFEFTLSGGDFAEVRELAEAKEADKARDVLVAGGVTPQAAAAFVQSLSAAPRMTILQTVKQQENGGVDKRDFTLVQDDHATWLIVAPPDASGEIKLEVRTSSREDVARLLEESI